MKAPIDKLFREKLAAHSLEAPPMAWEKIESNLPKKSASFLWLKIAASLVLLITAGMLLWPREQQTQLLADHTKPTEKAIGNKQSEKEKSEKEKAEEAKQQTGKTISKTIKSDETENKKSIKTNNKTVPQKNSVPIMNFSKQESFIADNDTPESKKEANAVQENTAIAKVDHEPVIISTEPIATADNQQSTTIVLAANDVSKYLKNTAIADATPEEENTSSFRKLLEKAADHLRPAPVIFNRSSCTNKKTRYCNC
jgi:hypothetical protein